MHVCLCCVRFSFSVLSREISWEECRRNDLFCVGWDVGRKTLTQSLSVCLSVYPLACLKNTRPNFTKFSVHVTLGRGSVLL